MIEPRKDAYGPEADTSNLADYLELLALAGKPLRRADLADYLGDADWTVRSRELFHDGTTVADAEEPSEDEAEGGTGTSPSVEAAERVFDLISDRETLLGDRYPFTNDGVEVKLVGAVEDTHRLYLALLAITVAHHYDVEVPVAVERAFEDIVAEAMRARGLLTIDIGRAGRASANFRETVRTAGNAVEVVPAPEDAPSRTHANDEGVDTLSHLSWGDVRPGHWLFIGQATCATSANWNAKILEPKPIQWARLMGSFVLPFAYLAVPHHVEPRQMEHLSFNHGRLILDRPRLCRYLAEVGSDQAGILDAVSAEDVFHPNR